MSGKSLNELRKELLDILFEEIENPFAKWGSCHYIITKYRIKELKDLIQVQEAREQEENDEIKY